MSRMISGPRLTRWVEMKLRTGFVDSHRTPIEHLSIQRTNGRLGFRFMCHLEKAIPRGSPGTAGALSLATKLTTRTSAIRDVHRGNLVQEGGCGRNSIARGRILGERVP